MFSAQGFAGATVDQIARRARLSKPNVLYYFPSKERIYLALLTGLMEVWLAPLHALDPLGDPYEQILNYVRRKLEMSREMPRESRLFANEILHGAPHLWPELAGPLRDLLRDKSAVIAEWMAKGRLKPCDPAHLIVSIWAMTQHYADFEVQLRAVFGPQAEPFEGAEAFLETLYARLLAP